MKENFTKTFVEWIQANQERLYAENITVQSPITIIGNGTYANFNNGVEEATVEIWDYGFSEFHVLDPQTEQVNVTHYEFQNKAELYVALDELVNQMSLVLV